MQSRDSRSENERAVMNTVFNRDSSFRYYKSRDSAGVWTAMVAFVCVLAGGSSLGWHSWILTGGILFGAGVVWGVGYWLLSKSCYFVSSTKAGFKDVFRAREVLFDEVRSVTKSTGRSSQTLTFVCDRRKVTMPLDPTDEAWFSAVKAKLSRRGIAVSPIGLFGVTLKEE